MSGPSQSSTRACGVCGNEGELRDDGLILCRDHAMIAYRLDKLRAAQTDPTVDLTGRMSHRPRDSHKGGHKRPFDVVPDDSLEQVARDVTLSVFDVPIWGVEALFQRIHTDLGKPKTAGGRRSSSSTAGLMMPNTGRSRSLATRSGWW